MYAPDSTSKKPSNRLSAMFSRQKSVDGGRPSLSPSTYPNNAGNNSVDSAYASSDPSASNVSTHTSPESRHANMVSIENNGQISGVDGSRHLQLNQKTGEVLDEDTGEVVTTVTTTTTTTTTVVKKAGSGKGGAEVRVETQPGHPGTTQTSTQQRVRGGNGGQVQGAIAEAPGDGPSARLTQPDHPPTFTSTSTARERSPVPAPLQIGRQPPQPELNTNQNQNQNQNPALPQRNPNRSSREFMTSPPSPITPGGPGSGSGGRHNFSYPARMGTKSTEHLPQPQHMVSQETMHQQYSPPHAPPPQQQNSGREGYSFSTGPPPQPQSKEAHSFSTGVPIQHTQTAPQQQGRSSGGGGALENLKAAAIGLHGVGETLRGTLNSEVDNRLSRRNPDKAAAVNAKNRADIERGQAEMARLRERNGLAPTIRRPGLEGDGGALTNSLSGGAADGRVGDGRVSERAPQLPPMNHNTPNSSTTTAAGMGFVGGQAGQGHGGAGQSGIGQGGMSQGGIGQGGIGQGVQPSKWDAPGTWGSGSVSANTGAVSSFNTGAQQQQLQSMGKPVPQVRVGEVHPALRGQGQPTQAQGQGVEGQRYGGTPAAAVGAQRPTDGGAQQQYPGAPSTGPGSTPANYGPGTSGLGNASGRGKPIPLNEPGIVGGNGSAAANVQHLSQQGNSHQAGEEERKKGGLGRLFKRKGVGA
ncbi:hypothetical protein LTR97_012176 [Elasticomyces elasticus]|uniref:Uncharacterized protein n=1 Tax=Elasticomyces elasticus TaxID=574655 RepID=A0AAN7W2H2_9PEZI|nr:hypothetical protein LTR97_012176 [Elasticomyces elasticus]